MNARIESMSHGDGKIYLQMVLDRLHGDSTVLLDARLKDGTKVSSHLFPFHALDPASQANYVVILPHFDVREVDLVFVEYSGQGSPLAQSRLTVELNLINWRAYFNSLVHNELMEQMFDIEREYSSDRMNIFFTDAIADGDELVVRMMVDMPSSLEADVMVDFMDQQGHELDLPVYPLLDEVVPAQRLGDVERLHLGFSVRVHMSADFCVMAYDANECVAGSFAFFCEETYEPLREAHEYYVTDAARDKHYEEWYRRHCATLSELALQREMVFEYQPLISLVVPLCAGDECYLKALFTALRQQTYTHFEVVVVNAGVPEGVYQKTLGAGESDTRILYIETEATLDEAALRLTGLLQSNGEICAVLDPHVMLAPEALFECVRCLNEISTRDAEQVQSAVLYTNYDILDREKGLCAPSFAPVFSPDLLYSYNYCGPFVLIARPLIDAISHEEGFASEGFGYDLVLKATARASRVERIDRVLYHLQDPHAYSEDAVKTYIRREEEAFRGGRKAVANHVRRLGLEAVVLSEVGERLYRVQYRLPDGVPAPSLSVVILTTRSDDLLEVCLDSLQEFNTDIAYEVVIVGSADRVERVQAYGKQHEQNRIPIRFVTTAQNASRAAMANAAVKTVSSDYVLFLDGNTEFITPQALLTLLAHGLRSDVGVVGSKLLFSDDTIQHAGMMVGPYGTAAALGTHMPRSAKGYGKRLICASNVSAVSGVAMMARRSVFNEVNGFDERFRMGYFDVDFCLKVGKAGYQVVYRGDVEFYHHERLEPSRALHSEQRLRAEQERGYLHYRWPRYFVEGDPYMSACLNRDVPSYLLAPIR